MVRSTNPFVERLGFFWHRHFANSRMSVSPPQLLTQQNDLFRRYADLGANPNAAFGDLAHEVTINPSMLRFLTGEYNVKGAPNENYARELMELFGLGVTGPAGTPNYSEDDVKQLAKAFSGWQIDDTNPDAASSYFTPDRWYNGPKIVFGKFGNYKYADAVDLVLAHPSHPSFLMTKLWNEFVAAPPDAADAGEAHRDVHGRRAASSSRVLEQILTHPGAVRLARRAEHGQAARRLRRRRDARARGRRSPTRPPPTTSTRWASSRTSRRPSRAGRAGCRG